MQKLLRRAPTFSKLLPLQQAAAAVHVEAFFVVKCCKWQGIFITFEDQRWHMTHIFQPSMNQWYIWIGATSRNYESSIKQNSKMLKDVEIVERSLRSAHCHMFFQSCACRIARTWAQSQHDSMTWRNMLWLLWQLCSSTTNTKKHSNPQQS